MHACHARRFALCRQKGFIPLSTYLTTYKLGDYVDIKVNAAVHKVRPASQPARRPLRGAAALAAPRPSPVC